MYGCMMEHSICCVHSSFSSSGRKTKSHEMWTLLNIIILAHSLFIWLPNHVCHYFYGLNILYVYCVYNLLLTKSLHVLKIIRSVLKCWLCMCVCVCVLSAWHFSRMPVRWDKGMRCMYILTDMILLASPPIIQQYCNILTTFARQ